MKLRHLVLAAALATPGVAWSAQCDPDLDKANTALASPKATVPAEDLAKARTLVSEGQAKLKAGDDIGCVVDVGMALELLDLGNSE